jgi:hypothetical protein
VQERGAILAVLVAVLSPACILAQGVRTPPVKPTDSTEVLFAAQAPDSEKDEAGKPALATFEPISFITGGGLRECYSTGSQEQQDAVTKFVTGRLNRAYASGSHYTLWSHGAPYGRATAISACFDEDIDFNGCFRFEGPSPSATVPLGFRGIAISGKVPSPTHAPVFAKADKQEETAFISFAVKSLAEHKVHVTASQVHAKEIDSTQLRAGHIALVGSVLVQLAAREPKTFNSYRMFLVVEESSGAYSTVLSSFHETKVLLDDGEATPKPNEELDLDEENGTDIETFFDSFPLFPGEPDVVISRHRYYEDWNFWVYRREGAVYRVIYSGCGGGD